MDANAARIARALSQTFAALEVGAAFGVARGEPVGVTIVIELTAGADIILVVSPSILVALVLATMPGDDAIYGAIVLHRIVAIVFDAAGNLVPNQSIRRLLRAPLLRQCPSPVIRVWCPSFGDMHTSCSNE